MPVRRSRVNGQDRTISIGFGKEVLTVGYNRSKYTPEFEEKFQKELTGARPGRALAKMLMTVLRTWDIVDIDPKDVEKAAELETNCPEITNDEMSKEGIKFVPLALTEDNLYSVMSVDALGKIVAAMAKDQRPNESASNFTENGFEPMEG